MAAARRPFMMAVPSPGRGWCLSASTIGWAVRLLRTPGAYGRAVGRAARELRDPGPDRGLEEVREAAGGFDHRPRDCHGHPCIGSRDTVAAIWDGLRTLSRGVLRILCRQGQGDRTRTVRLPAPHSRVRFRDATAISSWLSATTVFYSPPANTPLRIAVSELSGAAQ